ncbi:MAG: ABC transporter permease [Nitrososphaerota archaeon]
MRRPIAFATVVVRDWVRSRSTVFWTLAFPLILLLVFGSVFGDVRVTSVRVLVVNEDLDPSGRPTQLSEAFVSALNSTGLLELRPVEPSKDLGEAMRDLGVYRALVIHRGFQEGLIEASVAARIDVITSTLEYVLANFGQSVPPENRSMIEEGISALRQMRSNLRAGPVSITFVRDDADPSAGVVEGVIRSVAQAFNLRLIGANDSVVLDSSGLGFRRTRWIDLYVPGVLMAFVMVNGVLGSSLTLADMRRRRLLRRLTITPLRRSELLAGLMFAHLLMALVLTVLTLSVGWGLFGSSFSLNALSAALIVAGSLLFTSLGLVLGTAFKEVEAVSAAASAITFPMMFLSGAVFPLELAPPAMQAVAKFLPLYYLVEGLRASGVYGSTVSFIEGLAVSLAAFPVLLLLGSVLLDRELTT